MPIQSSEILHYRSQVVNDTSANGGRIDKGAQVLTNTPRNWFPEASAAQMTAGETWLRKLFVSFQNSGNLAGNNTRCWLHEPSDGDDMVFIHAGTQRDIQDDLTGSEDRYGAGVLDSGASSGASEIDVLVEDGAVILFRDTELLVLDDGVNRQFVAVSGTPSIAGDVVTITLAENLAHTFAQGTPVASVYEVGDVEGSVDNKSLTTVSGTLDEAQIVPQAVGAVEMEVTITFSSATNFSATALIGSAGDPVSLGSGNISTTFAPTNPDTGTAYFSIPSAAWGGTWASAETAEFDVHPYAFPIWGERIVPAGSESLADNEVVLKVWTESA